MADNPVNEPENNEAPDNEKSMNLLYHFSKNILFIAVLFAAVNIVIILLALSNQSLAGYSEVSPRLVFSEAQNVSVKTLFTDEYSDAVPNQSLLTGSFIKTDEASFAELQIDNNIIRIDRNTELRLIANNFGIQDVPRLEFELINGQIWINAFDSMTIKTERCLTSFFHTVGSYSYKNKRNEIFSLSGNIDAELYDKDGDLLNRFIIPLKNKIMFADGQLIPEYALLEYSKLKKELKLTPVSKDIFKNDWVIKNTADDTALLAAENHLISSEESYLFRKKYIDIKDKLTFVPGKKRTLSYLGLKNRFNYILGGVNSEKDNTRADELLDEIDQILDEYSDDSLFTDLAEKQFFRIRNVKTNTPAYKMKEFLREKLFTDDDPAFLRTYLSDINYLIRIEELTQSKKVADKWLDSWSQKMKQDDFDEFERQIRILQSIFTAYADFIDQDMLSIMDKAEDDRMKFTMNDVETLFEIASERLEMTKFFMAAGRYEDARFFLSKTDDKLDLNNKNIPASARDLFLKESETLMEKIAFAEESVHGSSEIDEAEEFKGYLTQKERGEELAEELSEYLKSKETPEKPPEPPSAAEVSDVFLKSRIIVLNEDIIRDEDSPFEFDIETAMFVDKDANENTIVFLAHYNFGLNTLSDIIMNDKSLKGSYRLQDFVLVALKPDGDIMPPEYIEPETEYVTDFLKESEIDGTEFTDVMAKDLAIQLMIRELEDQGIVVPGATSVKILDEEKLNDFEISGVTIENAELKRKLVINFKYSTATKVVRDVSVVGAKVELPEVIEPSVLVRTIFDAMISQEAEITAYNNVMNSLTGYAFLPEQSDLEFTDAELAIVKFEDLRFKTLPIIINGTYDTKERIFTEVHHELLDGENIPVDQYMKELSELFVIDFLSDNDIDVTMENIVSELPADKIVIQNYEWEEKTYSFIADINNNRLMQVSVEGIDIVTPFMSFEEFNNLK